MIAMSSDSLTVVVPAYNEADGITSALDEVRREILDRMPNADCVVVNDGSRDATREILDHICARDPRIRAIHQENRGHGPALRRGMESAEGAWLLLMDSDRQIPVQEVHRLWLERAATRLVIGWRKDRRDPGHRRLLSRLVRGVIRLWFGAAIRDANAPFKLLPRELWRRLEPMIPLESGVPSILIAVGAARLGFSVVEMPVEHRKRTSGSPSLRPLKLLWLCLRSLQELRRFRATLPQSTRGDGTVGVGDP